ncbi:Crp/Fnr family transcriptional regulator [Flavobacterium tegetincola]|uniref:Crp/Fnr family transcriptional regulator n=1 Tax=Flavobacterium tegetincola TaxID=150172 RepID=UPI000425049B|nr:Crp/Fnr family transcriptional regulator [Flavobacterium tegetincola]
MTNDLIQHLSNYIKLSDENTALILNHTEVQHYKASDFFIESGDKCDQMAFLISGVFRFCFMDHKGNEITSYFMKEDDFVSNITSFFEFSVSSGSIQAETNCEVIQFSRASWDLFCAEIPEWENSFQKIVNETLVNKINFQRSLLNLDAKDSYLKFLKTYPSILQRVPLNHVASFLGITPFSLSRIRKSIASI